eukprot:CAMPEP_0197174882 /NCGR_PEP_ID=MMETSP1423-20130617/1244_1 /TAXON_ID=476441 /ORGANISM="Pseudo-nitzschia heimii, Strain UNC1101" /LENGTH=444 /DNA_ID=CAMNT_0042623891 /DNA_START=119 /DNA_END=1453 /DNA_ORIENTATION=+
MVSSRNSPLLLLLLDGVFFDRDRTVDAFVLRRRLGFCSPSDSELILNSFSYLGDDGDIEVEEYPTATSQFQPSFDQQQQQQPFPFQSPVAPEPSFDFPVRQEEMDDQEYQTELFVDETPPDLAYPQYPEPEVIANPYEFTSFGEEDEQLIDAIPTVVTPIPRGSGAIRLASDPVVAPAIEITDIWETEAPEIIQGASLKTWDFNSEHLDAVQVLLKTEGRPMKADIELWQGENAPQKISVYSENGNTRPISAFIATPYQGHTAVAVKNAGEGEFPMKACVEADLQQNGNHLAGKGPAKGSQLAKYTLQQLWDSARPKTVQGGGATYVVPLESNIQRVQILITSEKNPINARIEILEGPNNVKQVMEISTEDGKARPFFCVLDLPDPILTNVMRVVNSGPFEFPFECRIEPFKVDNDIEDMENLYFLMDGGPSADQTSSSPFLLN